MASVTGAGLGEPPVGTQGEIQVETGLELRGQEGRGQKWENVISTKTYANLLPNMVVPLDSQITLSVFLSL